MQIIEEKDKTVAYSQHQKLFNLCERLFNLSQSTIGFIDENWRDFNRWDNYKKFLALLLARNSNAFMGCVMLCNEAQRANADCLLRVIVESFIVLKFVQTNKDELSDKFLHYGPVSIKRYKEIYERTKNPILQPLMENLEKHVPEWEKAYEKVKNKYPDKRHWAGKDMTLKAMAIDAGILDIYDSVYQLLSEVFHSSPQSFSERLRGNEAGWEIDPNEKVETIDTVLAFAFTFYYDILDEIRNEFQTHQDEDFQDIWKEFQGVRDSNFNK